MNNVNKINTNTQLSIVDMDRSIRDKISDTFNDLYLKSSNTRVVQDVGKFIYKRRKYYMLFVILTSILSLILLPIVSTLVKRVQIKGNTTKYVLYGKTIVIEEKNNILTDNFVQKNTNIWNIPVKNSTRDLVYTSKRFMNSIHKGITINASIPTINLYETKSLEKINKEIGNIYKKIEEITSNGDEEGNYIPLDNKNNKNIYISYKAYRYNELLSLAIYIKDNMGEKANTKNERFITITYNMYTKRALDFEQTLEYLYKNKKDYINIIKKEMARRKAKFNKNEFIIDANGRILLKLNDMKFIEIK